MTVASTSSLNRLARLLIIMVVFLSCVGRAETPMTVCQVIDNSWSLNGKTVTVRGFLNGSPHHGYMLFAVSRSTKPCAGWNEEYFTTPSVIALGEARTSHSALEPVLDEMRRRYRRGDFSPMYVEVVGTVSRKWLIFIFRKSGGGYVGNGFGQSGGTAVLIKVEQIKKLATEVPVK
jgi:hypothetical protein